MVVAGAAFLMAGPATAADLGTYKPAEEPAETSRRCELSANAALTTDYVFRGFSQTDESPAIQGGFDAACGPFYVGIWGSSLDFGGQTNLNGDVVDVANLELDFYGGITHDVNIFHRTVTFDLGVIYYHYPNAFDSVSLVDGPLGELDYVEIKFGWSYTLFRDFAVSSTLFYSPEYTGELGKNVVLETSLEKPLGHGFTLSGTIGNQWGDEDEGGIDYTYWNIGLAKSFYQDKFSIEVRYWDTDNSDTFCDTPVFQCDERVVGTLSASF